MKLLNECEGHTVTVEMISGDTYRGLLMDAEDNMNMQMQDCTKTDEAGTVTKMKHVYIRGSKVRFALMPDMLKNAPMFKRFDPKFKDKTVGFGTSKYVLGLGLGRGEPARQAGNQQHQRR